MDNFGPCVYFQYRVFNIEFLAGALRLTASKFNQSSFTRKIFYLLRKFVQVTGEICGEVILSLRLSSCLEVNFLFVDQSQLAVWPSWPIPAALLGVTHSQPDSQNHTVECWELRSEGAKFWKWEFLCHQKLGVDRYLNLPILLADTDISVLITSVSVSALEKLNRYWISGTILLLNLDIQQLSG